MACVRNFTHKHDILYSQEFQVPWAENFAEGLSHLILSVSLFDLCCSSYGIAAIALSEPPMSCAVTWFEKIRAKI